MSDEGTLHAVIPKFIDLGKPEPAKPVPKAAPKQESEPIEQGPPEPRGGMGKDVMTMGAESREAARKERDTAEAKEAKPEAKEASITEPVKATSAADPDHKPDDTPAWQKALISKEKSARKAAEARTAALEQQVATLTALVERVLPKPKEASEPKEADYASQEEYDEARIEYRAEQRANERIAKQAQAKDAEEGAKVMAAHQARMEKFAETHPEVIEFATDRGSPINGAMGAAIALSDQGPQVLLYLSENTDEAMKIYKMHPSRAAAEIGKIEDRLAAKPAPAKPSKVPEPLAPVGQGERVTRNKYAADVTDAEYFAQVDAEKAAELAALRRRAH